MFGLHFPGFSVLLLDLLLVATVFFQSLTAYWSMYVHSICLTLSLLFLVFRDRKGDQNKSIVLDCVTLCLLAHALFHKSFMS